MSDNSAFDTNESKNSAFDVKDENSAFVIKPENPTNVKKDVNTVFAQDEIFLTAENGLEYHLVNLQKLGQQGAMGESYKAQRIISNGKSSQIVFFKKCLLDPQNDKKKVKLFTTESELTCRNCGPNIIRGICYGDSEGRPFLVAEFYEGESLEAKIKSGVFKEKEGETSRNKIVLGLLDALIQLKDNGIIHRDLKPANVIVRKDGKPIIVDLGLACQESYEDLENLSKIGTEGYAAPEQIHGGKSTYASDIYALGIIFLEMLTGSCDLSSIKSIKEKGIKDFIERCCKENPEERFASAEDAKEEFKEILATIKRLRNAKTITSSKSATPQNKSNKWLGIAVAIAFVALCIVLYPKDIDKLSEGMIKKNTAVKTKVIETKNEEPQVAKVELAKQAESEMQKSATITKPADFDDTKEFFDNRDGRVYKLLKYADKVWLASNLSYAGKDMPFAKCYGNTSSCEEFGRLYDYESAQKACPTGFRLPQQEDWERVLKKVGAKGANKLKSYDGFAALSAGYYQRAADSYFYKGELAGWWVGESKEKESAKVFNVFRNDPMMISKESVTDAYSVRCIKE